MASCWGQQSNRDSVSMCQDSPFPAAAAWEHLQGVLRPSDDPLMARSIPAIVEYIESPAIQGNRGLSLEMLMEVLRDHQASLPNIGIAPRALLLSALEKRLKTRGLGQSGSSGTSFGMTLEQWLPVRSTSGFREKATLAIATRGVKPGMPVNSATRLSESSVAGCDFDLK